jgi:CheY-like chemotaxis protein
MRTESYATGDEALKALRLALARGDPYDFVIANDQMAGIDGVTLVASIKSDFALRDTLIILLTSVREGRARKELVGNTLDACVNKPVAYAKLLDTLAAAWAEKASSKIAPRVDTALEGLPF